MHSTTNVSLASSELDLEFVPCPMCGGAEFIDLIQSTDYLGGGEKFRVVRCATCGLAFTNPRPTPTAMVAHYPQGYGPHQGHFVTGRENLRSQWVRLMERAILRTHYQYPPQPVSRSTRAIAAIGRAWIHDQRRRAEWIPFCPGGRLLDFGCGAAQFGRRMREYGWSVEGIEPDAEVASRVESRTGIRIHVGSLPHEHVLPESFDVVTMWSALEHVHEPLKVVQAAHEVLQPGGILLVYVPNLESWASRNFRSAWFGLDLPRHLVHFTEDTLRRLLVRVGFHVRSMHQVGRDGWLRKSVRRAAEAGGAPGWTRALDWKPAALLFSRWTERTGQADSILAIAERPKQ